LFYSPLVAPLISIGLIFSLFTLVFAVNTGYPLTALLEHLGLVEAASALGEYSLSGLMEKLFELAGSSLYSALGEGQYGSFLVSGVLAGVASVLVFVPLVAIVMAVLGVLEDTGLLPRLAIGTHLLLQKIGLSGHSLLPITLSLGCNVPGVMATRATPSHFERLKAILLMPFIPCQARLVVLLAIATAIGGVAGSAIVPLAYLVSFLVVALLSYLIDALSGRRKKVEVDLLLEIPPLHRPYLRVVWWFTWFYLKHFLVKAGTVIFLVNIASWGLQHLTPQLTYTDSVEESIVAGFSKLISPLLGPLGIAGDRAWVAAYALVLGFLAKELVVSAVTTATGALTPQEAFRAIGLSQASAVAFALFVTLYVPCAATIAAVYSEAKNPKFALASIALMVATAFSLGALAYQLALLLT